MNYIVKHVLSQTFTKRVVVVAGATASQSVDLGFISQVKSYQKTSKIISTLSCLALNSKGIYFFVLYCLYLSSIHEKANCIAIF